MGHKIFVSYKYADDQVQNLDGQKNSTVRNYVDKLETFFDYSDHIYKGESDNEDLSHLSEDTIWAKLRDRIFDSTLTIIFISPGMKVWWQSEKEQWIPWEVSFSLRETKRKTRNGVFYTSKLNAMLAVVLPDTNGSYDYFLENKFCCDEGCLSHHTNKTFEIIRSNMFNHKSAEPHTCNNGSTIWYGECSYIQCIKWNTFISNIDFYVDSAYKRQEKASDYKIQVNIN